MRTILALALTTALALPLATTASGASHGAKAEKPRETHAEQIADAIAIQPGIPVAKKALIDVHSLYGSLVRDEKGNELGKVDRLIMEPDGHIHYVVLTAAHGMLSLGDEVIAVPWNSVSLTSPKGTQKYVLTAARQTLKPATTFDIPAKTQETSPPQPMK